MLLIHIIYNFYIIFKNNKNSIKNKLEISKIFQNIKYKNNNLNLFLNFFKQIIY